MVKLIEQALYDQTGAIGKNGKLTELTIEAIKRRISYDALHARNESGIVEGMNNCLQEYNTVNCDTIEISHYSNNEDRLKNRQKSGSITYRSDIICVRL